MKNAMKKDTIVQQNRCNNKRCNKPAYLFPHRTRKGLLKKHQIHQTKHQVCQTKHQVRQTNHKVHQTKHQVRQTPSTPNKKHSARCAAYLCQHSWLWSSGREWWGHGPVMVMQHCPGVLERLGLAYLRQQATERAWWAGPPTQLSHCPNLGLTSPPPSSSLDNGYHSNWKPHKPEQNYATKLIETMIKANDWMIQWTPTQVPNSCPNLGQSFNGSHLRPCKSTPQQNLPKSSSSWVKSWDVQQCLATNALLTKKI